MVQYSYLVCSSNRNRNRYLNLAMQISHYIDSSVPQRIVCLGRPCPARWVQSPSYCQWKLCVHLRVAHTVSSTASFLSLKHTWHVTKTPHPSNTEMSIEKCNQIIFSITNHAIKSTLNGNAKYLIPSIVEVNVPYIKLRQGMKFYKVHTLHQFHNAPFKLS